VKYGGRGPGWLERDAGLYVLYATGSPKYKQLLLLFLNLILFVSWERGGSLLRGICCRRRGEGDITENLEGKTKCRLQRRILKNRLRVESDQLPERWR
jgi:hypothetical protein